jgi:hypothetical protein
MSGFFLVLLLILAAILSIVAIVWVCVRLASRISHKKSERRASAAREEKAARMAYLNTLDSTELERLALDGDVTALKCIEDEQMLQRIRANTAQEHIRQSACGRLGHQWDFTGEETVPCQERGGGQHLDPCYGVSCEFCERAVRVRTYTCSLCGVKRTE